MKKLLVLGVIGFTMMALIMASLIFIAAFVDSKPDPCLDYQNTSGAVAASGSQVSLGSQKGLTVKGATMNDAQRRNAVAIAKAGLNNGASVRDLEVAIAVAIQESTLLNLLYGYPGSSSLGLFQQIAAWGSVRDRTNPYKSAVMFFIGGNEGQHGLLDLPDRSSLSIGEAAQAVQGSNPLGSGDPVKDYAAAVATYQAHADEAQAIVDSLTGAEAPVSTSTQCEKTDPVEEAVQAAISKVGSRYEWDDPTGLGSVCWAYEQAGITLSCDGLFSTTTDPSSGVVLANIPLDQISSPSDLKPGDIIAWRPAKSGEATRVSLNTGTEPLFGETDINIGTYNVHGSNHTGHASAMSRIHAPARLIAGRQVDIVGMQEFQQDQRVALMKLLPDYSVYPALNYRDPYVTVNSIIYNHTKYEVVESSLTPMPMYFNHRKTDIPLVKFRNIDTDQEFYVVNTHDPAKPIYQYLRYLAAKEHARLTDRLFLDGLPIYFTGDFNSGFGVRLPKYNLGNLTYQNKRQNLTWCIMTKSGVMRNAYDALKGRHGCPRQTTNEKGLGVVDHVYVSQGVKVEQYVVEWNKTGSDHPFVYIHSKLGNGENTITPKSPDYTLGIGKTGGKVGVNQIKVPDQIVSVLRPTIVDSSTAPSSADGEWIFPLEKGTYHYEPDSYGPRILNGDDFHNGTDFGTSGATPDVFAMHDGEVVRMEWSDAWGNYYVIETGVPVPDQPGNTYKYLYAHLSSYQPFIAAGTKVTVGQKLGNVGDTGNSYGEHLHLTICTTMECTYGDKAGTVDPVPFLKALGISF